MVDLIRFASLFRKSLGLAVADNGSVGICEQSMNIGHVGETLIFRQWTSATAFHGMINAGEDCTFLDFLKRKKKKNEGFRFVI